MFKLDRRVSVSLGLSLALGCGGRASFEGTGAAEGALGGHAGRSPQPMRSLGPGISHSLWSREAIQDVESRLHREVTDRPLAALRERHVHRR
jgi:hypothetical protein